MTGKTYKSSILLFLNIILNAGVLLSQTTETVIKSSEFIFTTAPFKECHASTIEETPEGLVVAFFGGTEEKNPDVCIWFSNNDDDGWSAPREVANGIQQDGIRYPCWNPVLYQVKGGQLMLFYKVGPDPREWWGMLITSDNNGKTWSQPQRLPDGILGPIKNKPVMLDTGVLLCPSSVEGETWQIQMEMTADTGKTWTRVSVPAGKKRFNAIQPSILFHKNGKLQILCRSKENWIVQSWSRNNGNTWSPVRSTTLPNPNSGIDAVTLKDGRQLVVYNPTTVPEGKWTGSRTPLCVAVSKDGKRWHDIATLESEPGEFSYPYVIQTSDGMVHIVYTWKRETIKHVAICIK